ncbi:MAG: phosphoribosylanthranilate isomerase [Sellimonas intestinalis]
MKNKDQNLRPETNRGCNIWVNVAEPDYCGFIFNVSGSRRSIGAEQLNILVDMLNPEIVPIGVFVNEKTDVILRIVRESGIRMVQLHGQENGEIIHTIQSKAQVPVIKAVSVRSKEDVRSAVLSPADYLLFDCGEGGTGQTFLTGICLRIFRGRIFGGRRDRDAQYGRSPSTFFTVCA